VTAAPGGGQKGFRITLTVKLAASVVASFAAFVALVGYLSLREHRRHSEELVLQSADRISDVILRSTEYQMLHNDRQALYQMINDMGSEPGLRRIRIFNEEGRITFSTDPAEVNTVVNKQAEACYGCHAQASPLARLNRPDRARIFTEANGGRVLGIIRPVENRPACYGANCHPPARSVLGTLDTNLSLANVDAQLADYRRYLARLTALSVLLGSLISVGFILLEVHRPVRDLIAGTKKVAGGNLDHRLAVHSEDELGELAASFNKMTEDLARARAEITAWTRSLEDRVARKTQELEQAYTGLVASEKMASLGKLAATVAHEVNNPLFGILTYSRLVLKDLETAGPDWSSKPQAVEQLRIIERESKRCGEIMKNLLAFARQAPPHRQPQDVNVMVRRALVLVRHQLELQGVELADNLAPDLPRCMCDGDQIQQIALVLLVNAIEALPAGGHIEVATSLDPGGAAVQLRVRDSGTGIAADVLPHIFEPFFTTKEHQHRTGLGLAVASNIAGRHNGRLTVHSEPERGAEFTLTLPLESPEATETTDGRA
jgi:two-component system NtrC family sensor kinase